MPDIKKFRVPLTSRSIIEPEEIFFDSSKLKQFEEGEVDAGKLEKEISGKVFSLFEIIAAITLVLTGCMTAFFMIAQGGYYRSEAEDNSSRALPIFAERGLVYASDGTILARNELSFDLIIKGPELPRDRALQEALRVISQDLGKILGRDGKNIYHRFLVALEGRFAEVVLGKGIGMDEIARIANFLDEYPFLEIRESYARRYEGDMTLSHIIGYTGEEEGRVGKMGLEVFYDEILQGEAGAFIKKIDAKGKIFKETLRASARRGKNITLSIDAGFQKKVAEILARHMRQLNIDAAVVVILDPRNGGVRSLVSFPTFDANAFESGIEADALEKVLTNPAKPLFHRAISGEYPSGSTIKPILAAAALEEHLVSPEFLVYSSGSISVPSVYDPTIFYVFKDWKVHGWTDIRKAIADSVNVYFYTIGGGYKDKEGLGMQKIEEYAKKFGWGEALGIDLPGEADGNIPTAKWKREVKGENWYIGDTYMASIGQGDVLVTPLQVAAATAVFANYGTLFAPRIVAKIQDEVVKPQVLRTNFISRKNIQVVREGMRRAVTDGSSRALFDVPYAVAGKTGTAEVSQSRNHAWFTGFAPYENPEIVITVLLEKGEKSDYAVRVAKDIFEAYFNYPQ